MWLAISIAIGVYLFGWIGGHFADVDESNLSPWMQQLRGSKLRHVFMVVVALVGGVSGAVYIKRVLIPAYQESIWLFTVEVAWGVILGGVGVALGHYITHKDSDVIQN